jgi:hypothetical protein
MDKYLAGGIKISIEEGLKEVKKCKIHILMLEEKNSELCIENNKEIERLNEVIENRLREAEDNLKLSGERKIDTSVGWVAYREMPDSWEYDDEKIIEVVINKYPQMKPDLLKTTITIKKEVIKKLAYIGGLPVDILEFVTKECQEPKFNYKLNGGVL